MPTYPAFPAQKKIIIIIKTIHTYPLFISRSKHTVTDSTVARHFFAVAPPLAHTQSSISSLTVCVLSSVLFFFFLSPLFASCFATLSEPESGPSYYEKPPPPPLLPLLRHLRANANGSIREYSNRFWWGGPRLGCVVLDCLFPLQQGHPRAPWHGWMGVTWQVSVVTSHGGRRVHWQLAHYDQINALSIYPSFLPLRWLNSNIRLPPLRVPPLPRKIFSRNRRTSVRLAFS